ncbi:MULTISPECIES: ion channel [Brevundimonas]|uniref:ion channel n=1 Tax=Brevundimonas sp. UBA7507 TaxID=1946137 RepID=UPI00257CFEA9|nr:MULTISPECIES: ion channel [Brevundimonas]
MIPELLAGTVMVLATVGLHAVGLLTLGWILALGDITRPGREVRLNPLSPCGAAYTVTVVLGLFVLHGVEVWLYAALFYLLGAVPDLREAVYFSSISYSSIGYGDTSIDPEWKLLGAIEGINGAILLGWTVAFFVTVMGRLLPSSERNTGFE